MPVGLPWQDRVEIPEPPLMVVALRVQTKFVELVVTARVTVPAKPLSEATVIVDVAVAPAFTFTLVGLAVTVKSRTVKFTVAE